MEEQHQEYRYVYLDLRFTQDNIMGTSNYIDSCVRCTDSCKLGEALCDNFKGEVQRYGA